jgi:hypothetical protein
MVGEVSLASSSSSSRRKIMSLSGWPERVVVPPLPGPARRGAGSCSRSLWGRWRSWACRSAAFRASIAARPAGPPAFHSRDWRAGWVAGAAGETDWPDFRDATLGDEAASAWLHCNIGSGSFKFETDGARNCYSACSFAFLGGKWRIAADQSIGVHQHYTDEALNNAQAKAFTAVDISAEQIIAGILADYIVRMGVDARFLTRASMAGPTEIYKFSSDEMTKFAITWNDLEYSDWSYR